MNLLDELNYSFSVIGVSETKIGTVDSVNFHMSVPGYKFEYVLTPLTSRGVGMYVKDSLAIRKRVPAGAPEGAGSY